MRREARNDYKKKYEKQRFFFEKKKEKKGEEENEIKRRRPSLKKGIGGESVLIRRGAGHFRWLIVLSPFFFFLFFSISSCILFDFLFVFLLFVTRFYFLSLSLYFFFSVCRCFCGHFLVVFFLLFLDWLTNSWRLELSFCCSTAQFLAAQDKKKEIIIHSSQV